MGMSETEMARVVAGTAAVTKSAKIRALATAGYSRADIAKFVGCRYQFVRNVLVDDERKAERAQRSAEVAHAADAGNSMKVKLDGEGRVAIPPSVRQALGLKPGDTLIVSAEDGDLHFLSIPSAIRKAQAIVRKFVPEGVSLADELIDDRRREAENGQSN